MPTASSLSAARRWKLHRECAHTCRHRQAAGEQFRQEPAEGAQVPGTELLPLPGRARGEPRSERSWANAAVRGRSCPSDGRLGSAGPKAAPFHSLPLAAAFGPLCSNVIIFPLHHAHK